VIVVPIASANLILAKSPNLAVMADYGCFWRHRQEERLEASGLDSLASPIVRSIGGSLVKRLKPHFVFMLAARIEATRFSI
jgi:hypothetical protein